MGQCMCACECGAHWCVQQATMSLKMCVYTSDIWYSCSIFRRFKDRDGIGITTKS